MKKWLVIYVFVSLIIFGVFLIFGTNYYTDNAEYLESRKESVISFQTVNANNGSYIIMWGHESVDDKVVRIDKGKKQYKVLEGVYYKKMILIQYQYINDSEEIVYGVGNYNIDNNQFISYDIKALSGYKWLAFGIREESLYCLMSDIDNKTVREYKVNEEKLSECELLQEFSYPEEQYIIKAQYYKGRLNICLEDGTSYYYSDMKAVNNENIDKSPFAKAETYEVNESAIKIWKKECFFYLLKRVILYWISGFVIIGLLIAGIIGRGSLVVKMFSVSELVMGIVIIISTVVFYEKIKQDKVNGVYEYGENLLKEIPEKIPASGEISYEELIDLKENAEYPIEEIMIIGKTADSLEVINALNTPKEVQLGEDGYYGKKFSQLLYKVTVENSEIYERIEIGNEVYFVVLIRDTSDIKSDRIIAGFINGTDVNNKIYKITCAIFNKILYVYIIGSLIIAIGVLIFNARWEKFSKNILNLVKNSNEFIHLKKAPMGTNKEWGALEEIHRNLGQINYEKSQNFEIYKRFMPKDIERVLNKKSILDVELGDTKEITGTVVTINIDNNEFVSSGEYMKTVTSAFEIVNKVQKRKYGVIISEDCSFFNTKVLFEDEVYMAVEFAIETLHRFKQDINLKDKEKIIIMNYSKYQCGVSGCKDSIVPYVYSVEENVLMQYVEPLRRAGVRLVLTESAANKCSNKFALRYIGFITENGKNIKLYECMDAYSNKQKELLINTHKIFKKALGLFYSNDFYLARNTFNEVLKENAEDRVARWYLFNCEHNLNNTEDTEVGYGLFENKIYEQQYRMKN